MGTMGWVALTVTASVYYVIPKIYGTEIYSVKLANLHFWLVLVGQLIFSITGWITGIQQGAMWKALTPEGTLKYTFMETLVKNYPYWHVRSLGVIHRRHGGVRERAADHPEGARAQWRQDRGPGCGVGERREPWEDLKHRLHPGWSR